jgi:hypothetical protein
VLFLGAICGGGPRVCFLGVETVFVLVSENSGETREVVVLVRFLVIEREISE